MVQRDGRTRRPARSSGLASLAARLPEGTETAGSLVDGAPHGHAMRNIRDLADAEITLREPP